MCYFLQVEKLCRGGHQEASFSTKPEEAIEMTPGLSMVAVAPAVIRYRSERLHAVCNV